MASDRDIPGNFSRRAILAAGLGLILVIVLAKALVLLWLHGDTLERYQWHLANLAGALAQQTQQSVQSIDLAVSVTVEELKDRHSGRRDIPDGVMFEHIRERINTLPHVRAMAVVDSGGNAVLHSSRFPAPAVNYGDREDFLAHRKRRIDGLYIGEPVSGRVIREPATVYSRRLEDGRGEFRGIVFAAVRLPYYERIYGGLNLGAGGRVFLFRADGVLLAVHPVVEDAVGRSFADDPLFTRALVASGGGIQRGAGLIDGEQRMIAFERLKDYPLVVAVSSTEDYILSAWRGYAWRIGVGGATATGFIGIALFFLLRQLRVSVALKTGLEAASARVHGVIQSAMDAVITVDEGQKIVLFNAAAESVFRCPARQALGESLDRFIPERFRAAHRRHVERFGATGITTRMMGARLALAGLRADGEEFPIDASISQVTVGGRKHYTVILRDITERKRAEDALERSYQELRELSAAMHEVREAERMRIARELHDELAQWLTALKMDVSWLAARLPREASQLAQRTEKMKSVVDTTVAAVRRIAADLRPVMLDDLGLVPAVEYLLHGFSERTGIMVSLDIDAKGFDFRDPLATAIYRMLQEALTNVARHAQASELELVIKLDGDRLLVRARDNGKGIDPGALRSEKSFGILGIRERARTLGGQASVYSPAEGGTVVEITVPAARYRAAESP